MSRQTHIVLLRGINVGGRNRLPMAALRGHFEAAGCGHARRAGALDPDRSPPDRFRLIGRELFLSCPNGMARTKLTSAYLDTTLGTVTTIRNWRTTLALLELVDQ